MKEQSARIIFREEIARAAGWVDTVADCDTGEVPPSRADWVPAGLRGRDGAARALGLFLQYADPIDATDAEVAILLLGELDDPEAAGVLAETLAESDEIVGRALAPLRQMTSGPQQSLPEAAARRLSLATPAPANDVQGFAAQQRQSFRRLALRSLGRHDSRVAVEILSAALDDTDPRTRLAAAEGLSRQSGFPQRARIERIADDAPEAFQSLYEPILAEEWPIRSQP